jgi:hypothetical protein
LFFIPFKTRNGKDVFFKKKNRILNSGGVLMEPQQPGNKKLPDFDQLNDRVIADSPSTPSLVIKTNLDSKDATENNPYFHDKKTKDSEEFKAYFEE